SLYHARTHTHTHTHTHTQTNMHTPPSHKTKQVYTHWKYTHRHTKCTQTKGVNMYWHVVTQAMDIHSLSHRQAHTCIHTHTHTHTHTHKKRSAEHRVGRACR